jgi:hypothetical protein
MDVSFVRLVIPKVANAMIRKASLPDFPLVFEFLLRAEGKPAFDELDRLFEARCGSDRRMKVLGHYHEVMKQEGTLAVVVENFQEQPGPPFIAEEHPALGGLRRDEIGLPVIGCVFSRRFHFSQGLKPASCEGSLRHG